MTSSSTINALHKQLAVLTSEAERKDAVIEAGKQKIEQQEEQRWDNWVCKVQLEAYKADWSFWFWCVGSVLRAIGLVAIGLGLNWCKKGSYCRNCKFIHADWSSLVTDAFALAASTEMISHVESLRIKKELVDCKKEYQELKDQHTSSSQTAVSSYNSLWQRYASLETKCAKVTNENVELLQTVKLSKDANAGLRDLLRQATANNPIQTKRFAQPAKAPSQKPSPSFATKLLAQIKALTSRVAQLTAENDKLQQTADSSLASQHQAEARLSQAQSQCNAAAQQTTTLPVLPSAQLSVDTQQQAATILQLRETEKTLRFKLNIAEKKIIHLNALRRSLSLATSSATRMQSVHPATAFTEIETELAKSRRQGASLKNQLSSEQKLTSTVPLLKAQITSLECSVASLQAHISSLNTAGQAAEQQHMQDRREAAQSFQQQQIQLEELKATATDFDTCFSGFARAFSCITSSNPADYCSITPEDFDQLLTRISRTAEQYETIDEQKSETYDKLIQLRTMVEACAMKAPRKGLEKCAASSSTHKRTKVRSLM